MRGSPTSRSSKPRATAIAPSPGQLLNHLLASEYLEKPYAASQVQAKVHATLDAFDG